MTEQKRKTISVIVGFDIHVPEDEFEYFMRKNDTSDRDLSVWEYITAWDTQNIEKRHKPYVKPELAAQVDYMCLEVMEKIEGEEIVDLLRTRS